MAPFRTKARRLWAGAALAGTGLAAALLSAGGASAGDPPDPLGEKTGGDTTVYATGRNAFSFPAANLEDAERTRFVIGNSFFKRNWVEAGASTRARDGLGPHFIARSCGGCHVQDGRGEPPEIFNRLGETRDPIVSLLIRLSIPGTDPHGGPRPEPVYGDQLNTAAVQGVKPEGTVTLRYETVQGRFADGTPYTPAQAPLRRARPGLRPAARRHHAQPAHRAAGDRRGPAGGDRRGRHSRQRRRPGRPRRARSRGDPTTSGTHRRAARCWAASAGRPT